jgi:GH15 family glucan-1,4-alpha-glucosidase
MIGGLNTVAMVSAAGSIDWLCLPRIDSAACFAAMLGDEGNGHWSLAPSHDVISCERRYRPDTLILETRFSTATGTAVVIDFMPACFSGADVVRIVRGISGTVDFQTTLRMRFDYGSVVPWVHRASDGIVAIAGPDALYVRSTVELEGQDHTSGAQFSLSAGEQHSFVLTRVASNEPEPEPADAQRALEQTQAFWTDWIANCSYTGKWPEQVRRSLITLKALTYAPTGGIAAAATTSLPEQPGGSRNWDYRYCWLRDSTFVLDALISSGFTSEAVAWRDWLLRAIAGDPSQLQVLYAVDGSRRLPEQELDWLSGFGGATPVRIGNAAASQFQLDIYGELLNGLALARDKKLPDSDQTDTGQIDPTWSVEVVLCEYLETIYERPDRSLWEIRGEPKHFVHSKVMCWVAFDRMVSGAQRHDLDAPVQRWRAMRDNLHAEICERGIDTDRNCFVQSYGCTELDAALLLLPLVGFLPWDDERIINTVHAVRAALANEAGLVRRYESGSEVDGLSGGEGYFLACSFWLVEALAGIGEVDEAHELFTGLLGVANDVGLIAEEYAASSQTQLGNTPQAYSHVGLINAARRLDSMMNARPS